MTCDVMRVRLHLRQIRVVAVVSDTSNELVVEVESTLRRVRCAACGFRCARVHDTRRRKIRDADRALFEALFDAHPRLKSGWQALQQFHGLYLAADHHGALAAVDRFCDLYETGELPEFHDIMDTFTPGPRRSSPGTTPAGPPTGASRAPFSGACRRVSSMSLTGT